MGKIGNKKSLVTNSFYHYYCKNIPLMEKEYTEQLMLDFGADGNTLVPVITQDSNSGKVLILAYVSRDAYKETILSGYATFYSRSRKEIWKKGLTSGNLLKVIEIRINCEQNSLLYLVTQEGKGACHVLKPDGAPQETCFYRRIIPGDRLEMVVG
jgi:phosphoribosyl-AMP cyclohydrolase